MSEFIKVATVSEVPDPGKLTVECDEPNQPPATGVASATDNCGAVTVTFSDQVVLTPLAPCGHCYFCSRSQPTLCVDAQKFMTGLMPDGTTSYRARRRRGLR